jgi:hypothetical protein
MSQEPVKPVTAEPSARGSTPDKRPSRKSFASEDTNEAKEQIKKTTLIDNSNEDDAGKMLF